MAHTETLRPNAAGDSAECNIFIGCEVNYQCVDEVVADDDTSFVTGGQANDWELDLHNIENHSAGSGTINSITVYARAKLQGGGATNQLKIVVKSGGTTNESSIKDITTSWVTYSNNWATDPSTGAAWAWDAIDALQIGYSLYRVSPGSNYGDCTQVYVEVDYNVDYTRSLATSVGLSTTLTEDRTLNRSLSTSVGLSTSLAKVSTLARSLTTQVGLVAILGDLPKNLDTWLCIASRDGGSTKTRDDGANWTSCAKDASGNLLGAYFAQFDNRLCVIRYQDIGFAYSSVNDITANWTDKPNFPNLPQKFTNMFVGRDAGDDPVLQFITPIGVYYLDVFSNFVFGPTEVSWEYDSLSGKKGIYWKGDHYIAVGKGIYKVSGGVVTLVGPDMDDGLPEDLQGTITDMIGVGFWLVIALDGGADKKSCILKRYITGNHWHCVYEGSLNASIKALCWDSGTLYFGEGTDVKSLPFSNKTENVAKLSTHTYSASGDLIYPYFHSEFEAMPKVAHKVRAVTQDCDDDETITISYRTDEATTWTELGSFITSPRPTALPFPASGDSIGISFERIQFKAAYARGSTTTNSPKLESLILEYRVVPPVLWGWDFRVQAVSSGDQRGQDIINALKTAIETGTLLSFYPDGDKSGTEYFVEVKGMPGNEAGTGFGTEGVYLVSLEEVID